MNGLNNSRNLAAHSRADRYLFLLLLAALFAAAWMPGQLRAQGIEQRLYSFGLAGAANPEAGLIQGADGALYGTTARGGNLNYGTVFRLIPWPAGAGFLQISRAAGQGAQLSFVPPVDAASAISVSSDLINWTPLTNLPASLGPVYFIDASATNFAHRFYRAAWTQ